MRATPSLRLALLLAVVLAMFLSGGFAPAAAAQRASSPATVTGASSSVPTTSMPAATPSAPSSPAGTAVAASPAPTAAPASPAPASVPIGWKNGSFFQDVDVQFGGTGIPLGFQEVPYVNELPTSTLGFWINISATAPLIFANLTIWGNSWPGSNASTPISGFTPTQPAIRPMAIDPTDPALASYYVDVYRFFWPGSSVSFNLTVVGENSTPSELKSTDVVSVPENYPGGFVDNATWVFDVASPWTSSEFTSDISVTTTPNVLGANVFAPNPRQSLDVSIASIPVNGVAVPIPSAALEFTVYDVRNGTAIAYSEPFGPVNHTTMSLVSPIGPFPGQEVSFNVTAWLPWEGGEIDILHSPQWMFNWSTHGGWWHPVSGLLANVQLVTAPNLGSSAGGGPGTSLTLPTDQPLTVTIHEPIENVTIASAQVVFTFNDSGASHSGTIPMAAVTDNTSAVTLPGLPDGARLTFSIVAKDIYGNPVASGNYTYSEAGPTNPSLPAGRGLLFLEVFDLTGTQLVGDFAFSVSNATWSDSGVALAPGFATPLLPSYTEPVELTFGAYLVTVHAFGVTEQATVVLSSSDATPTVVFLGETHPAAVAPGETLPVDSLLEVGGVVAAALLTLPLLLWFDERRAKAEEEQRRITL